jgi:hypothetical protein
MSRTAALPDGECQVTEIAHFFVDFGAGFRGRFVNTGKDAIET